MGNLARMQELHPNSFPKNVLGLSWDHREQVPRFKVSSEGRRFLTISPYDEVLLGEHPLLVSLTLQEVSHPGTDHEQKLTIFDTVLTTLLKNAA